MLTFESASVAGAAGIVDKLTVRILIFPRSGNQADHIPVVAAFREGQAPGLDS